MTSIYQTFIDLLSTYIFGNNVPTGSWEELMCILISTLACLFVVLIPFIVVYKVVCMVCGR